MTREEAIKRIKAEKALICGGCMHPQEIGYCENTCKLPEAYDTAIEALQAEPTHGRLIDADALSKKLCETTIFIKDGELFQRMINDAPTVSVVDITQRELCEDISCTDCPFMKETCKLMDYVAYAEAVQGEWVRKYDDKVNCYWYECDQCGEYRPRNQFGHEYNANFCPNCGAKMKGGDDE